MPKKIMIVDDEEDMRIYLQTIFRKAGYDTDIAVNGEEALQNISFIKPDLITLDILMPQKSGLNFFEMIRNTKTNKRIPIIVVSGVSGHSEFFSNNKDSDITAYLEKPIKPDELVAKAKKLLGD
ncbi:MAG: response regulator [candidate division Zixibacteria bacterium]|nr:response regulator [candidate division Zixibacteria bacterium]